MAETKMLRMYDLGKCFYQWDTGRKLIVNDDVCSQVHFSNESTKHALVCKVYDEGDLRVVDVPNILLQDATPIKAYLNVFDDSGRLTTHWEIFPVVGRKKPEEYVYTETEVLSYSYLDKRLDNLEGDGLANAIHEYLAEHPVTGGASPEEVAQIHQNKQDIETLNREKLSADALPEAVREYLEENPITGGAGIVVSENAPDDTSVLWIDTDDNEADNLQAAIDDALAQAKASGEFDGKDYVLTDADKQEIAELAADMVDVPTDAHINSLINTALGVIENGTY